jgi:hypothetical protein
MIRRELQRKDSHKKESALRFWKAEDASQIESRMADRFDFLTACGRVSAEGRAALLLLADTDSYVTRSDFTAKLKQKESSCDPDQVIDELESCLLVYVRMDRATLTDRNDRIYLLPVVHEHMKSVRKQEWSRFEEELGHRFNRTRLSAGAVCLEDIFKQGGFYPLLPGFTDEPSDSQEFPPGSTGNLPGKSARTPVKVTLLRSCMENGLLEPAIVHNERFFIPFLVMTARSVEAQHSGEDSAAFKQTLYLTDLTNFAECLSCRNLDRKNINRNLDTCLHLVANTESGEKYRKDLRQLKVLVSESGSYRLKREFIPLSFEKKIDLVVKLLGPEEREIRSAVRKLGRIRRTSLISLRERKKRLKQLFLRSGGENTAIKKPGSAHGTGSGSARCSLENTERAIDSLVFRGILVQDQTGSIIGYNDLRKVSPAKGSLIVNNDFEILVYPERIAYSTLYLIACYCRIVSASEAVRLKIERDTVLRGIAVSGPVETFLQTIETASLYPIGESIRRKVEQWASRFVSASMRRRFVITLPSAESMSRVQSNTYIKGCIEEQSENTLIMSPEADPKRLERELRREQVFVDLG